MVQNFTHSYGEVTKHSYKESITSEDTANGGEDMTINSSRRQVRERWERG